MTKEEKGKKGKNGSKEENDMQTTLLEKDNISTSFKDFLNANKDKVRKLSESNATRNKDGMIVLSKDDEWRNEQEWNKDYEDLKRKR